MRSLLGIRMLAALALAAVPFVAAAPAIAAPVMTAAPVTPAVAPPAVAPPAVAAVPGDVNDFTFSSFDAQYELGIDAEGHSTLRTTETFVAEFPEADQNHGIQRAIPTVYRGHPTHLDLVSVTDAAGTPRPYDTESDDETLVVTIADDGFVHGAQSYVLTYTQRDVTAYFENTDDDEFYWDTNGVQWKQPFTRHTTTTVVAPELVPALTGDTACFVGASGSDTPCTITADGDGVFTTTAENLGPAENVTIGIAFAPHTFTPRDTAYLSVASSWVQLIATLLSVGVAVTALVNSRTRLHDAKGRPVIVPEYTVPPGADLLIASAVTKHTTRAAASSFVDFAVRHQLQIVERTENGFFGDSTAYWLRLLRTDALNPHERELAAAVFGADLQPGAERELKKKDPELAKAIYAVMQQTRKRARAEGYIGNGITGIGSLMLVSSFVLGVVSAVAGVLSSDSGHGDAAPALLTALAVLMVAATVLLAFRTPLTAKGAELRDYVAGIEMYVKWAEEDRFRVLQSPEGALRTGVNAPDWGQVVKLYEKLLPYAVLLGLETEWAKVLGTYYENLGSSPEWYGGSTAFNAGLFASSMSALSSTAASAYSGSSSSSSSGFSGGGGSSGGGGGGGGGRGV